MSVRALSLLLALLTLPVGTVARAEKTVVIVGGGYGGLHLARKLARKPGVKPILLDQQQQHTIMTRLAERVVRGTNIQLGLNDIAAGSGFDFVRGKVEQIDTARQEVLLKGGRRIKYDALTLATGASAFVPDAVRGLSRYGLALRSHGQALKAQKHLERRFVKAALTQDVARRQRLTTVVVVGGSKTGVEVAAELAEAIRSPRFIRDLARRHASSKVSAGQLEQKLGAALATAQIVMVDRGETILRGTKRPERRAASRTLRRLGVKVVTGVSVDSVTRKRTVQLKNGETIKAGTVLVATGIKASMPPGKRRIPLLKQGFVAVDERLMVRGMKQVFAIGDVAGAHLKTAQEAQHQASYVARSIVKELRGKPVKAYRPFDMGALTSLGRKRSAGVAFGIPIKGRLASMFKLAIELKHELPLYLDIFKGKLRQRFGRQLRRPRAPGRWSPRRLFPRLFGRNATPGI